MILDTTTQSGCGRGGKEVTRRKGTREPSTMELWNKPRIPSPPVCPLPSSDPDPLTPSLGPQSFTLDSDPSYYLRIPTRYTPSQPCTFLAVHISGVLVCTGYYLRGSSRFTRPDTAHRLPRAWISSCRPVPTSPINYIQHALPSVIHLSSTTRCHQCFLPVSGDLRFVHGLHANSQVYRRDGMVHVPVFPSGTTIESSPDRRRSELLAEYQS